MKYGEMKVYDICCGSAAFSYGFHKAGYHVIGGFDIDKTAVESARMNLPLGSWECTSIEKFSRTIEHERSHPIFKSQIFITGLPCQGFSVAGICNPNDKRNHLYLYLLRIIKNVKPEFVLIENVRGLLSKRNTKVFESILRGLKRNGYQTDFRVYNAANLLVPQRRERVFILGSRNLEPTKVFEKIRLSSGMITTKEALVGIPMGKEIPEKNHVFMQHSPRVTKKMRELNGSCPISYRLLKYNEPSLTIISGHNALPVHPSKKRAITVREAARLQGLPDEFKFSGTTTSQIVQVANAVPPNLGYTLGIAIKKSIRDENKKQGIYKQLHRLTNSTKEEEMRDMFTNYYKRSSKKYPWRKSFNPYQIIITEILLQRTKSQMVAPIWKNIISHCVHVFNHKKKLGKRITAYISKIGILNRIRTIDKLNESLRTMYQKRVPSDFEKLMSLPGIGIYIASATRTFAFSKVDFPVDSNGFRFISRFFGIELKQTKIEASHIRRFMNKIMPDKKPKEFVYGFLDFCSSICKPVNPKCGFCSLRYLCKYYKISKK